MNLSTVISLSKYSELNTLSIKEDTDAIVAFINLGLLQLYNLFPLKTEEALIQLEDGKSIYDLPDDFMYMTGAFEAPFEEWEENSRAVPINEEGNPYSINTINFKQVQIPLSLTGTFVSILYVPKPTLLSASDLSAEVPIPDHLVQCLLLFIAYKAHSGIRIDGQQSEGDIYYGRFLRMCEELKEQGTTIAADDVSMESRYRQRGFP